MFFRRKNEDIHREIAERDIVSAKPNLNGLTLACVFSCPGKEEMDSGEFLSGTTGENFLQMISFLHENLPDIFISTKKCDYYVDNSSEHVYYKGYMNSKKTTPYVLDITSEENKQRLITKLSSMEYVISFGKDAEKALTNAGIKFIKAKCHLGTKGLRSLNLKSATTEKKLRKVAEDLVIKINKMRNIA